MLLYNFHFNFILQLLLLYHFHFNFILFVHTSHAKFGFIDVQYLQNVVFSIEIGLNGPNHSSTDFHHPMKKFQPSPKLSISLLSLRRGKISPYPFNAIWKTLVCFTFPSQDVEKISTYFPVWLWIVTQFNT